jgi:Rieske Fe-S protein
MMKKLTGRALLNGARAIPTAVPAVSDVPDAAIDEGTSRRAFLQGTAGAAASAAVILATPKVVSAIDAAGSGATADPKPVVTKASGTIPQEPVTAYVHNAERHEVTVLSGTRETTYKDPALVKRLLDAAR